MAGRGPPQPASALRDLLSPRPERLPLCVSNQQRKIASDFSCAKSSIIPRNPEQSGTKKPDGKQTKRIGNAMETKSKKWALTMQHLQPHTSRSLLALSVAR